MVLMRLRIAVVREAEEETVIITSVPSQRGLPWWRRWRLTTQRKDAKTM